MYFSFISRVVRERQIKASLIRVHIPGCLTLLLKTWQPRVLGHICYCTYYIFVFVVYFSYGIGQLLMLMSVPQLIWHDDADHNANTYNKITPFNKIIV